MRIAVVNLTSGGLSGGYRKYLEHLVPRLRSSPGVESLDVFAHPKVRALMPGMASSWKTWPARDALSGHSWLRSEIARCRPDVVFIPTARWLGVSPIPVVVMIRNMEPLVVPWAGNSVREGMQNVVRAEVARRACVRAERVIAVSEYVRDFVTDHWKLSSGKVGVVYHGIDSPAVGDEVRPTSLPAGFESSRPMLFTAGSIRPARGLEDLLRALAHLRASGTEYRLIIAGSVDAAARAYRQRLEALGHTLGVADLATYVGVLRPSEMSWCFRQATAFVMTSRVEACPNIALEAMAHGAICVSADNAPMPEFFGKNALYYTSGDGFSLARALGEVNHCAPTTLSDMRAMGIARAADFSWTDTAERTRDELASAVALRAHTRHE